MEDGMTPQAKKILEDIRTFIDTKIEKLDAADYQELLEEVASDCEAKIECSKEEERSK